MMSGQDWIVTNDGQCSAYETVSDPGDLSRPYRLYRFLTDLEEVLTQITDDGLRLEAIRPLVRRLLISSSWLQMTSLEPNPETGWEVMMLYDEPFFPLTIQLVAWAPGMISPIHNHASWGLVALLSGQENNTFWRRDPSSDSPHQIKPVGTLRLSPGDILCFSSDAIHQVEAIATQPTLSFNLYGETNYNQRFEFDPIQRTAKTF